MKLPPGTISALKTAIKDLDKAGEKTDPQLVAAVRLRGLSTNLCFDITRRRNEEQNGRYCRDEGNQGRFRNGA